MHNSEAPRGVWWALTFQGDQGPTPSGFASHSLEDHPTKENNTNDLDIFPLSSERLHADFLCISWARVDDFHRLREEQARCNHIHASHHQGSLLAACITLARVMIPSQQTKLDVRDTSAKTNT